MILGTAFSQGLRCSFSPRKADAVPGTRFRVPGSRRELDRILDCPPTQEIVEDHGQTTAAYTSHYFAPCFEAWLVHGGVVKSLIMYLGGMVRGLSLVGAT